MNKTFHSGILRNVADFTSPKGYKSTILTVEVFDRKWLKGGGIKPVMTAMEFKCFGQQIATANDIPNGTLIEVEGRVDAKMWKEKILVDLVAEKISVLSTEAVPTKEADGQPAPSESEDQGDQIPF